MTDSRFAQVVALLAGVSALVGTAVAAPGGERGPPGGGQGGAGGGITWQVPTLSWSGIGPLDVALWSSTLLFGSVACYWVYVTYVRGGGYEPPAPVYGGDEVQVRILTVDAEDVVQRTVDSLPGELDDRHVVAESPIDVDGAEVHVVPDSFSCEAVRKGRAIEWARQHLDSDREFALYLDEDSEMTEFTGLPDADVVQLKERPRRTDSRLTFLADVYRLGVQLEQRAFARMSIPLFAWGGGIAVRQSVEDAVTWDRESLVEDTAFVWAAAKQVGASYELAETVCTNQAPPTFGEIFEQRRRWAAGNHQEAGRLPTKYRLLAKVRNYAWALSPVVTVAAIPLSLLHPQIAFEPAFQAVSVVLVAMTGFWFLRGLAEYGQSKLGYLLALPLLPVVSVVHSAGTVAGILRPPESFRVTEKV
jgi:hypothetical protein